MLPCTYMYNTKCMSVNKYLTLGFIKNACLLTSSGWIRDSDHFISRRVFGGSSYNNYINWILDLDTIIHVIVCNR